MIDIQLSTFTTNSALAICAVLLRVIPASAEVADLATWFDDQYMMVNR